MFLSKISQMSKVSYIKNDERHITQHSEWKEIAIDIKISTQKLNDSMCLFAFLLASLYLCVLLSRYAGYSSMSGLHSSQVLRRMIPTKWSSIQVCIRCGIWHEYIHTQIVYNKLNSFNHQLSQTHGQNV